MTTVSIFGKGNMGQAIGKNFEAAGNNVSYIQSDSPVKSLEGSGLAVIDAGSLKRARELEAMGFLQISLAAAEKISWTGGFGVFH